MKANNKIGIVIVVAAIVAVITTLITPSITGNVIKVDKDRVNTVNSNLIYEVDRLRTDSELLNNEINRISNSLTENVRASSCDEDPTCEARHIESISLTNEQINTKIILIDDFLKAERIFLTNSTNSVLSGRNNTDYVCVIKTGQLVRSTVPCEN